MRRRKHPQSREFEHGGARVTVVFVEGSARLLTVRGADPMRDVRGCIVKLVPDGEATPEERASVAAMLRQAGAAHVWIAPRAPAPQAVAQAEPAAAAEPARAVAMRMVEQANTRDRDRLRAVVDDALTQEGA
jgi:hypothetical protein